MAEYQADRKLSDQDTDLLVKFLDALTGEHEGKLLK